MIKCDVTYCANNEDGVCKLEDIKLNIGRCCIDYVSPESLEDTSDLPRFPSAPTILRFEQCNTKSPPRKRWALLIAAYLMLTAPEWWAACSAR